MRDHSPLTTDLRRNQHCPAWCDGSDHRDVADEIGSDEIPTHFRMVASSAAFSASVAIEQALGLVGGARVELNGWNDDAPGGPAPYGVRFTTSAEARAVGAWLMRAADLVDFGS